MTKHEKARIKGIKLQQKKALLASKLSRAKFAKDKAEKDAHEAEIKPRHTDEELTATRLRSLYLDTPKTPINVW